MWAYYDRRVAQRKTGPHNVLSYFRGLGVRADLDSINVELHQVKFRLRELPSTSFLDLGAGPSGDFTRELAGDGLAMDQSMAALRSLRSAALSMALVRADAMRLPVADKALGRVFISHLYGLLLPDERAELVNEASRVGREIVILDCGRPTGANAEEWQSRTLPDGTEYPIFRRHLDIETLISEVGGEALFDGQYFVMIRRPLGRP
ncbi:MAG: class I SAM-dependent methyltransferase [Acidimicrobiales bacterium]